MSDLTPKEIKEAMKAAIREWLDDKFAEFGRWSFGAVLAALVAAATIFVLHMNGWHQETEKIIGNAPLRHGG
jgi:hypothetical protein